FLKAKRVARDVCCRDALWLKIPGQRDCFVVTNVPFIESLAIQVAGINDVVIEQRYGPDPFAHQRGSDVADQSARADAQDVTSGVDRLVEAKDLLLPIL